MIKPTINHICIYIITHQISSCIPGWNIYVWFDNSVYPTKGPTINIYKPYITMLTHIIYIHTYAIIYNYIYIIIYIIIYMYHIYIYIIQTTSYTHIPSLYPHRITNQSTPSLRRMLLFDVSTNLFTASRHALVERVWSNVLSVNLGIWNQGKPGKIGIWPTKYMKFHQCRNEIMPK